ncbi:MAG: hypothetical protein M3Z35_07845, partial [Nitrospirota bacterium]|nr:hypothetical protein [Nitrospirota bacterium]
WGPAIIGAAVASVTNPIAAQISARLSATTRASSRQSDRTPTPEQRRGRRSQRRVAEDKAGGGPLHNDSPSTADFDAESQEAHTQRSAPA